MTYPLLSHSQSTFRRTAVDYDPTTAKVRSHTDWVQPIAHLPGRAVQWKSTYSYGDLVLGIAALDGLLLGSKFFVMKPSRWTEERASATWSSAVFPARIRACSTVQRMAHRDSRKSF